MSRWIRWGAASFLVLGTWACGSVVIIGAPSEEESDDDGAGGRSTVVTTTTAVTTTSTSTAGGQGGDPGEGGAGGAGGTGGSPGIPDCVETEPIFEQPGLRPADIVFVIDNSGSMTQEIAAVEQNINVNFAQIIGASGVDYQVIMLTDHGSSSLDVCIGPPLSNTTSCTGPPGDVPNQFHHYDVNVQSFDSLCIILDTLFGPNNGGEADEQNLHPEGWSKWLRSDAVKVFVEITDDDVNCSWGGNQFTDQGDSMPQSTTGLAAQTATTFDQKLRTESPSQFGTAAERNYQFYSIVGVKEKMDPLQPYTPEEPVVGTSSTDDCSTASGPGWAYQWLSKGTDGLRFPVCQFTSYDAVFQAIAAGVVEEVNAACTYTIKAPGVVDLGSLMVTYNPGDPMVPPQMLSLLPSMANCGNSDSTYYVANDKLELCPATCERLRDDPTHTLDVTGDCL